MPVSEKRHVERFSNVLVVNFRQLNKSRDYILGVANNYSHKGISFEAARIESNPGEALEFVLQNPYSELSVAAVGEIVWKVDGWYKCTAGIKLKEMDQDTINNIKDLKINEKRVYVEPSFIHENQEQSEEADKEDIADAGEVFYEAAPESEIIPPFENISSVANEQVDSPAEVKVEINKYRYPADKLPSRIIITGFLLIVSAIFALRTPGIRPDNAEKIKQTGLSKAAPVTRQPPLDKKNAGTGPAHVAVKSVINTEIEQGSTIHKAEKSRKSQKTAVVRKLPLMRGKIKFDSDSDVISPAFHSEIDKFAKAMLKDPGALLEVQGFADSIGPKTYNLDLAMRRALEVKEKFVKKGINDRRIKVTVYGDEFAGAGDRRVVMTIVPSGRALAAQ